MSALAMRKELIEKIQTIPDEVLGELLSYADYLEEKSFQKKFEKNIPKRLVAKDNNDLVNKLEQGVEDIRNKEEYTFEEAFEIIDKI